MLDLSLLRILTADGTGAQTAGVKSGSERWRALREVKREGSLLAPDNRGGRRRGSQGAPLGGRLPCANKLEARCRRVSQARPSQPFISRCDSPILHILMA